MVIVAAVGAALLPIMVATCLWRQLQRRDSMGNPFWLGGMLESTPRFTVFPTFLREKRWKLLAASYACLLVAV